MFRIDCTETIWTAAEMIASYLPIYENSHREQSANQVGSLGEVLAEYWFKLNSIQYHDERQYTTHDYRLANGRTIDVKTKDRKVAPLPDYDCSVPLYNHDHQRPDYYLFVSLEMNKDDASLDIRRFKKGYILGAANIAYLNKYGKKWKAGQVDARNGTKFWTDCINISIGNLAPLEKCIEVWKGS